MPNAALIVGKQTVIQGLEGAYDVLENTAHKLRTRTGSAPLENGAEITDHAVSEPIRMNLTGIVSDLTVNGEARAREAWEIIVGAQQSVQTFRIVTPWIVYPQMLIKDVDAHEEGFGIGFTIKLEEIQIVGREEAVPSFEALPPAKDRQPLRQFGTVANVANPNVSGRLANLRSSPILNPLTITRIDTESILPTINPTPERSNNPLDWLKDVNDRATQFINALNDNDLINAARDINDVFQLPLVRQVVEIDELNDFLNGLDGRVAEGRYTQAQATQARMQISRAVKSLSSAANTLNERRKMGLIRFASENSDNDEITLTFDG